MSEKNDEVEPSFKTLSRDNMYNSLPGNTPTKNKAPIMNIRSRENARSLLHNSDVCGFAAAVKKLTKF
jgi:hypothetical protein